MPAVHRAAGRAPRQPDARRPRPGAPAARARGPRAAARPWPTASTSADPKAAERAAARLGPGAGPDAGLRPRAASTTSGRCCGGSASARGATRSPTTPAPRSPRCPTCWPACCASRPPAAVVEARGAARLLGGVGFRAFSPAEVCPDNCLVTGGGARFLDFEWGCFRDVALTAAHAAPAVPRRAPRPARMPAGMAEAMLAAWHAEVVPVWPELATSTSWRAACCRPRCCGCGCAPARCCPAWSASRERRAARAGRRGRPGRGRGPAAGRPLAAPRPTTPSGPAWIATAQLAARRRRRRSGATAATSRLPPYPAFALSPRRLTASSRRAVHERVGRGPRPAARPRGREGSASRRPASSRSSPPGSTSTASAVVPAPTAGTMWPVDDVDGALDRRTRAAHHAGARVASRPPRRPAGAARRDDQPARLAGGGLVVGRSTGAPSALVRSWACRHMSRQCAPSTRSPAARSASWAGAVPRGPDQPPRSAVGPRVVDAR